MKKLALASVALLSACGTERSRPIGAPPTPAVKGVDAVVGGTVTDGTNAIAIPAMALAEDTVVEVRTEDPSMFPDLQDPRSDVFIIEPEGTVLSQPAAVTLAIETADGEAVQIVQLTQVDGERVWRTVEDPTNRGNEVEVLVSVLAPLAARLFDPPPVGQIAGLVLWSNEQPAAGAPIELVTDGVVTRETAAAPDGAFGFSDVASGEHTIVVDWECRDEVTATVRAGETTEILVLLCGG